ncbi:MAG TPA: Gar1/Naf1 family protein [Methanobacteriaceae archaeon]|nr:Gar1/Naf1 family protein [Methanobacteriaceae archaeon]
MKKLGNVLQISNRGRIILRSTQTPAFGLPVFTSDQKKLGYVHDIFGPTKDPYIAVKVPARNSENLDDRVGETLYVPNQSKKANKKWGRRKRSKK